MKNYIDKSSIKFRVWSSIEKQFIYCGLDDYPSGLYGGNVTQRFTGVIDKNGKEIYEGDLVNFLEPGFPHEKYPEEHKNEEVWWNDESAAFFFGKFYYDGWHGFHPYELKNIEVVGNIFENPELLKK